MEDRELLELAAKAAGVRRELTDTGEAFYIGKSSCHAWDPLNNDDDALRLAVKLRIEITFFEGFYEVHCEHCSVNYAPAYEPYGEDIEAATRRAIVRSAAEIAIDPRSHA